jgi:hypothetical protein
MTLQSSGQINFSQIANEFGLPPGKNLGAYRISETLGALSNLPLDSGIPQSGQIKFSNFYSKKLNMVVNYYDTSSGPSPRYRVDGRRKYNDRPQDVRCLGGFRTRPANTSNTKVFLHVNLSIGSEQSSDTTRCAMKTGNWDSNTELYVDVGGSGEIIGAGGDGGEGGSSGGGGTNGGNGTSGLGIQYSGTIVRVMSGGRIQAGYAGAGSGGGGSNDPDKNTQDHGSGGGGGGGGAGLPSGRGGSGGGGNYGSGTAGSSGSNGSKTAGGAGGNGGSGGGSSGGSGGTGGGVGGNATNGGSGGGNVTSFSGTSAGSNGAAIRKSSGVSFTLINSGTVDGSTSDDGVS